VNEEKNMQKEEKLCKKFLTKFSDTD